jgi:solute carrier family 35 (adenosine 3'-phospho 5'-phosphosulfate transporter), member B3
MFAFHFPADSQVSPVFNLVGVLMISTALLFDAAIGNVQEKSMREYKASNNEVVLYSYGIGFIYLFIYMLFSGDIVESFNFCLKVSGGRN